MLSYGNITYNGRAWLIEGEPFVRARLKRVFPRVPQQAAKRMVLTASPENTRELQWFLQRYPMAVDRPDVMERLAAEHIETEQRLSALMAGHTPPADIQLALPPRSYQTFAAQMLELKKGLLLADDLGLGKTVTAICSMTYPTNLPVLVVCPAHLPRQWKAMINQFAPALSVHILKKGSLYSLAPRPRGKAAAAAVARLSAKSGQLELETDKTPAGSELGSPLVSPFAAGPMPDVIITSYHKLRGWAESLAGVVKLVIFDECQALRSPDTGIYKAAQLVAEAAHRRLGLSGTPIMNLGNEFHHVISVLVPDALGSYSEFIREWCTAEGSGKARLSDAKEFGSYLRREGIMLRRTRAEVGRELPPLTKVIHEIDADEKAIDALKGNAVALARVVLRHNEQFRGQKMQAAGEFDALLRQATGIAKAPYVAEFVKMLLDSGESIVLFGWHRAVYDMWLEALAEHNPVLYTGSESPTQKDAALEAFKSGKTKLLIMSLRSGAGVDSLQGYCHTVVFGELDWSPGALEQCIGRVYRDQQDEACIAYFLLSNSGSDPLMAEVLGMKREQIEGVRNPDSALAERIDTGENSIRRLAREFLERRGEVIEMEAPVVAIGTKKHARVSDEATALVTT